MANKLEVSFNSPQCGWMSIGESEFHTTTAHTPHTRALAELLNGLSSFLESRVQRDEFEVDWSRNPEEYKLFFRRWETTVHFHVVEYPPSEQPTEGEIVFTHHGQVNDVSAAFYQTFAQLYEDRETDEFEFNWRQPFPLEEFRRFENALENYGR